MRLLLDTDVIVAALRSPAGASAALLRAARNKELTILVSVPLFIEYEASCSKAEHRKAAGLSIKEVRHFLDGLAVIAEPVQIHYLWRPRLHDPADEMVLEAAVNGQAEALVTFNLRHFADVPAQFGILLMSPFEALRKIK